MIACYRLLINSQWTHTYCVHTVIISLLKKNVSSSQMRSDKIIPRYMFDKNFVVSISSKEDWTYHNSSFPDDICASQMVPDTSYMAALGQASTIKQRMYRKSFHLVNIVRSFRQRSVLFLTVFSYYVHSRISL